MKKVCHKQLSLRYYIGGITGEYSTPAVYFVSDEDVEEFDKMFPPKKKEKLPGQLF